MAKPLYSADKYTYRVTWSEDDQEHVGRCVEFPSLSNLDSDANEALAGIMKLVATVIDDMHKKKEDIPEPLSLQPFKGNIALRVPPELHRELATIAAEQGVSLNRLISNQLAKLGRD